MNQRHGCLGRACLIAFVLLAPTIVQQAIAQQSLEDLENEVLSGSGSGSNKNKSDTPPPVVEEEPLQGARPSPGNNNIETSNSDSALAPGTNDEDDVPLSSGANKKDADQKVYKDVDDFVSGPKSIPFKQIFVVKHQYIFKKGRHEIMPFNIGVQPGDSFRRQFSMGVGYLYHINESFAIEALHLNFFTNLETGLAKDLTSNAQLELERIEPVMSLGSSLQWSPFKGKSATAENIYHYEGYLFAGGGITQFEVGSSGMAMGGAGTRVYLNRRSTLKFELRDYYDFKKQVGNRFNILLGAGIFLGASEL